MTPTEKFEKWFDKNNYFCNYMVNGMDYSWVKDRMRESWLGQQKEIDRLREGIKNYLLGKGDWRLHILEKLLEEGKDEV